VRAAPHSTKSLDGEKSPARFFAIVLGLVVAFFAGGAFAGPVSVTPTTIVLEPGQTTALLTITNEGDTPTRFETALNAWSESESGETQLAPSADVIVFPQLIALAPRESKKIRIGTELPPAAAERSYRLILQELPALDREAGQVNIQVLAKVSLPIFLSPRGAGAKPALAGLALENGVLSFEVVNAGSGRFILQDLNVAGRGPAGQAFSLSTPGWYVLAGGRRRYQVALGAAECRRAAEIAVTATGGPVPVQARLPVSPAACGEAADSRFLKTASLAPS
jgi:fimbrial chaperone protein